MNMNIDDIKADWVTDSLIRRLDLGGVITSGLREGLKKMVLKELTLLQIHRADGPEDTRVWVLTSRHLDVKGCFFGFGSYGTGIPTHVDTPEYYGRDLEAEKPDPDSHLWEWRLRNGELAKLVQLWAARVHWLKEQDLLKRNDYAEEILLIEKLMECVTATMVRWRDALRRGTA